MKGNSEVIKMLQSLLAAEAHANIWYRNMWRVVAKMGVKGTAKDLHDLGTRAHHFMRIVKDRILDFKVDTAYTVGEVKDETSLTDTFKVATEMENSLIDIGRAGIKLAVSVEDEDTAEKLRHIEERHEENYVWLDEQSSLIAGIGEPMYIGVHLKKGSASF